NYTKTMRESLAEVWNITEAKESNVDVIRNIVKRHQNAKVKFKDGLLRVDAFTASAMVQVLDKVNSANKAKIENIINKGSRAAFSQLAGVVMKMDYDPSESVGTQELDEKFTKKDFDKNEDANMHSENAVELARQFGSTKEYKRMVAIYKEHMKRGHITSSDQKERDKLVMKYYPKLESVDLGEQKFDVKTAETKKGKITVNSFANLEAAKKYLEYMQKRGHKGIISQG
ncbi:uncharacterized protein METZ01_LOCUS515583, partial [marine metagenome]